LSASLLLPARNHAFQTSKEKEKIETMRKFNEKQAKKAKEAEAAASSTEAKAAKAKPAKPEKASTYVYVKPAVGDKKGLFPHQASLVFSCLTVCRHHRTHAAQL
jgi:hypothetical protein